MLRICPARVTGITRHAGRTYSGMRMEAASLPIPKGNHHMACPEGRAISKRDGVRESVLAVLLVL